MIEARNAVADLLDNRTLAELRAQANPRELADMYHI
jgi:DNA-binding IscR family transcriptional regulator